jgi:hypothetical protein
VPPHRFAKRAPGPGNDPRWTLTSEPPGAELWVNGKATGLVTPVEVAVPPPGKYHCELRLPDHVSVVHDFKQDPGNCSWTWGGHLVSLASLDTLERMAADAERPPTAEERAKTRELMGPFKRARIHVVRQTTYGLGGVKIDLGGNGKVAIAHTPWGEQQKPRSLGLDVDATTTKQLFDAFIAAAFASIVIPPHTGVPDELHYELALAGASGTTHRLAKFVTAKHRRFDELLHLVLRTVGGRLSDVDRKTLHLPM